MTPSPSFCYDLMMNATRVLLIFGVLAALFWLRRSDLYPCNGCLRNLTQSRAPVEGCSPRAAPSGRAYFFSPRRSASIGSADVT